MTKTD